MFNEKTKEFSRKQGKDVPVWQTPKYEQSKAKAIEIMQKYKGIKEGDFWILMNETKSGKMAYTGLIISHNACLKLNDYQSIANRFRPGCITVDTNGYGGSLVYTYSCIEQGIYEVGEVTKANCQNAYPYAMALKRCFDRVVLKLTKLAYDGVYSDSEAEEFQNPLEEPEEPKKQPAAKKKEEKKCLSEDACNNLVEMMVRKGVSEAAICKRYKVKSIAEISIENFKECMEGMNKMEDKNV